MGWGQTSEALDAAEDARTEAVKQFGEGSPEAMVADELAWAAYQEHKQNMDRG
jgi:hypothetical protein